MTSGKRKRPRRWLRPAKRLALAACLATLLVGLLSLEYGVLVRRFGERSALEFGVGGGAIVVFRYDPGSFTGWATEFFTRLLGEDDGPFLIPQFRPAPGEPFVLPLWLPLALLGAGAGCLFWADRRRRSFDECRKCGYDLAGLPQGACPECGAAR